MLLCLALGLFLNLPKILILTIDVELTFERFTFKKTKGVYMHDFDRALSDYENALTEEPMDFDEVEEAAREHDEAMCALGDEAYEDMKCGC